jgi:transposase-like protein
MSTLKGYNDQQVFRLKLLNAHMEMNHSTSSYHNKKKKKIKSTSAYVCKTCEIGLIGPLRQKPQNF